MIKKLPGIRKRHFVNNVDVFLCDECNGWGEIYLKKFYGKFLCLKCDGGGVVDWVTKITVKYPDLLYKSHEVVIDQIIRERYYLDKVSTIDEIKKFAKMLGYQE